MLRTLYNAVNSITVTLIKEFFIKGASAVYKYDNLLISFSLLRISPSPYFYVRSYLNFSGELIFCAMCVCTYVKFQWIKFWDFDLQ